MTDRTPHASLPLCAQDDDPAATHVFRQFFGLVAGPVSVWYAEHNTSNPTDATRRKVKSKYKVRQRCDAEKFGVAGHDR